MHCGGVLGGLWEYGPTHWGHIGVFRDYSKMGHVVYIVFGR